MQVTGLVSDEIDLTVMFVMLGSIWITSFVTGIIVTSTAGSNSKGPGILGIVGGLLGYFVFFTYLLIIAGLMGENFN
jgi:uncharacterized membrane protein